LIGKDHFIDKKLNHNAFVQGLFLSSGTSEGEATTEFLRQVNSERSLSVSFILLSMSFALSLRTGTDIVTEVLRCSFHCKQWNDGRSPQVNSAKCDISTSESRRILKSVDLNKGCSASCVTYLWENGVTEAQQPAAPCE